MQLTQSNIGRTKQFPLFNLGFRPFFLGASVFAIISMVTWMLVYFSFESFSVSNISISQWHAHEMLYGYGMAVVAGFLLTAIKNWTGIPTLQGAPLMVLFALWCLARLLLLFGTAFLPWAAAMDLSFGLMLIIAVILPCIQAKQWKQLSVVSKVVLLWFGNFLFYLGCFGYLKNGSFYAINGGILLFIGLMLMIGRRVIPFFIERGIEPRGLELKQYKWLDISILIIYTVFFLISLLQVSPIFISICAYTLFVLNGFRLLNWHTVGIWRYSLLWSLYVSAWLVNIGFIFYGLQVTDSQLTNLTIHIFTIGGIGLMTISMMSRVSLGHTGRDIKSPSRFLIIAFVGMVASVLFRVLMPMLINRLYLSWVLVASILWILSFIIFVVIYTPILLAPRVDGAIS